MDLEELDNVSPNKSFEKRFAPHLRRRLKVVLDECTIEEPAQIRTINFDPKEDIVSLEIAWPFRLPEPSGDSGDLWGTPNDIEALQRGFRKHLLQQKVGSKLSNIFQKEFHDFLLVHLNIMRWGPEMVALVETRAERRLAGRPTQVVDKADAATVGETVRSIKARLDKVRAKIKIWQKNEPSLNQGKVLKRISSEFREEMHGWLSIFRRRSQKLPDHEWRRGNLSDLRSWSSRELASQIAYEYLPREKGLRPTLTELRRLARSQIHQKVTTK
jgi:hypothetical protein